MSDKQTECVPVTVTQVNGEGGSGEPTTVLMSWDAISKMPMSGEDKSWRDFVLRFENRQSHYTRRRHYLADEDDTVESTVLLEPCVMGTVVDIVEPKEQDVPVLIKGKKYTRYGVFQFKTDMGHYYVPFLSERDFTNLIFPIDMGDHNGNWLSRTFIQMFHEGMEKYGYLKNCSSPLVLQEKE